MEAQTSVPSINSLYRLPFTKNDNPNGWVEITTHCNLKCPNCYRGCDRNDIQRVHESLEAIQNNIMDLVQIRNCKIISISGGEPLIHPQILEVIRFINEKKLVPWLHTNGLLLTKHRLKELNDAGLRGIIIRMDSLKDGLKGKTEMELNEERKKYAQLISEFKNIHLSFICVVDQSNVQQIPDIIEWSRAHSRMIDFLAFIPMRQVKFTESESINAENWIYLEDLCSSVNNRLPDIKYTSYLGSQRDDASIKWLQSVWFVLNGQNLGYASSKMIELFQNIHHYFSNKYAYKFGDGRSSVSFFQMLLLSFIFRACREITLNYLKIILRNPISLFRKATVQVLCYIIPPGLYEREMDLCDGCPDAILYNGKLYPSCGLEEIKMQLKKQMVPKPEASVL